MSGKHQVDCIVGEVDGASFASLMVAGKGCVDLRLVGAVAGMKCLFVAKKFRRLGVGLALVQAALIVARQAGSGSVNFTVRKHNAAAIALYQKFGAVCCYDDGEDWHFVIPSSVLLSPAP